MARQSIGFTLCAVLLLLSSTCTDAFSVSNNINKNKSVKLSMNVDGSMENSRRAFLLSSATAALIPLTANAAAPEILKTKGGVKYAITKEAPGKAVRPLQGDIVAVDYTGYLSNGQIFDATHAEGKKKELLFQLGTSAVIPGLNEVIAEMAVGQKVQAIIPPELAFGDDGICLENGECLIKPGSTLVYDVFLKKSSIPPP